jgi:hypothetical protein
VEVKPTVPNPRDEEAKEPLRREPATLNPEDPRVNRFKHL